METSLQVGNTATHTFLVTQEMQPIFEAKIIHPVCSTWDMAHQFEVVARKTLEPHLSKGEQGIGSFLSIEHRSPAPLGEQVHIEAIVTECDPSTLMCSITARIGSRVCATGKQIQRILPSSTINELIKKATSQ
jgi:fluoroacetyl-CoA thioesterase